MTANLPKFEPTRTDQGPTLAVVDMAGTSVEENGVVERAVLAAIDRVTDGRRPVDFDERFKRARGGAKTEMFEALLGDAALAARAHGEFEEELERFVRAGEVVPMPGAMEALEQLKEMGLRLALTTGFSPRSRDALLEQLGWQELVDLVLSPGGDVRGRPYPDLVLTALMRLGIDAVQRVAVVGDTVNDLLAGTRAGASVVAGVLTGAHAREDLERAPHTHIIRDVGGLPEVIAAARGRS
jgi:phosphonatase-like hydrolase